MNAVPAPSTDLSALLASVVRDEIPAGLNSCDPDRFTTEAEHHGVLPLVAEHLRQKSGIPDQLRTRVADAAARGVAVDLAREYELVRCLEALDRAGCAPLLLKGAQLAYTHYPRPDLRPRLDTDLLIDARHRSEAHHTLTSLGYEVADSVTGDWLMSQATYLYRANDAQVHAVDVHWKIANAHLFTDVLSYAELAASAVAIPALGPAARGLSDAHALLLACVHRVAHHFDDEHLIWLYDIHLIASRIDIGAWDRFAELAAARGVGAICRRGLERAAEKFGTRVPEPVCDALDRAATRPADRATAAYLARDRRHVDHVVSDLRALPGWRARAQLMREHLFPSARYMRDVYAPASAAPLPMLYAWRIVRGARRWFMRSPSHTA
jgi:hypothetical protein